MENVLYIVPKKENCIWESIVDMILEHKPKTGIKKTFINYTKEELSKLKCEGKISSYVDGLKLSIINLCNKLETEETFEASLVASINLLVSVLKQIHRMDKV